MQKIYIYIGIILFSQFSYINANNNNILIGSLLSLIPIFLVSKLYKYESGEQIKEKYHSLPLLRVLAFITNDSNIVKKQNKRSLFVFLFVSSFSLWTIISINLFLADIKLEFIFLGALAFSGTFSCYLINQYKLNKIAN